MEDPSKSAPSLSTAPTLLEPRPLFDRCHVGSTTSDELWPSEQKVDQ